MKLTGSNIKKSFGNHVILEDIDVSIEKGEIVGLLGRNGAGKSTLLKILAGINMPDTGMVDYHGGTIGYMSERNPLYSHMYVLEYLEWISAVKKIDGSKERIELMIRQVGLQEVVEKKINQLSKGFKQRLGLAATLLPDPEILILDEPINGLDPIQIEEYRTLVKSISENKIVILSSHLIQEIEALCDRVLFLNNGGLVKESGNAHGQHESSAVIYLVLNAPIDQQLLFQTEGVTNVTKISSKEYRISVVDSESVRVGIFDTIVDADLKILEMRKEKISLDQLFN